MEWYQPFHPFSRHNITKNRDLTPGRHRKRCQLSLSHLLQLAARGLPFAVHELCTDVGRTCGRDSVGCVMQNDEIRGSAILNAGTPGGNDPFTGEIGAIGSLWNRHILAGADGADFPAGDDNDGIFDRRGAGSGNRGGPDQDFDGEIRLLLFACCEQRESKERSNQEAHEVPMITWRGRLNK